MWDFVSYFWLVFGGDRNGLAGRTMDGEISRIPKVLIQLERLYRFVRWVLTAPGAVFFDLAILIKVDLLGYRCYMEYVMA